MAQIPSLAGELPYASGMAKKGEKKKGILSGSGDPVHSIVSIANYNVLYTQLLLREWILSVLTTHTCTHRGNSMRQ